MVKLYLWALGEKTLSYVPGGKYLYTTLGYWAHRKKRGWDAKGRAELSFALARKAKEVIPPGGTAMEIGTGWFNHDAILLALVGDYKVYLFDIEDKAKIIYLKNYVNNLLDKLDLVCEELGIDKEQTRRKLQTLKLVQRKEDFYRTCNFVPCITKEIDRPFLPEKSIDFMVGNCVLNHIPVKILLPELVALRRMLTDEGRMYVLIRHDDHWAFHDPSANQFNYYRYSDRSYKLLFETKFEFQNRLVRQEWLEIFDQCGLEVEERTDVITDQSKEQISKLPHIDSRFSKYPLDELAISYSYVLLRKSKLGN